MGPKGVANADVIIEACKTILKGMNADNPEWTEILQSVVDVLEGLKPKFFLKTNLSIPVTNKCKKDALELQEIAASDDLARFPEVLGNLKTNMEKLLKEAKMDGVIIT